MSETTMTRERSMVHRDEVIYARLEGIADLHYQHWCAEANRALAAARLLASHERSDPKGLRIIRDVAAGHCPEDRIDAHLDNRRREFLSYMAVLEAERRGVKA